MTKGGHGQRGGTTTSVEGRKANGDGLVGVRRRTIGMGSAGGAQRGGRRGWAASTQVPKICRGRWRRESKEEDPVDGCNGGGEAPPSCVDMGKVLPSRFMGGRRRWREEPREESRGEGRVVARKQKTSKCFSLKGGISG
jgi:hypothetical protein